jgi:hypothetical protein
MKEEIDAAAFFRFNNGGVLFSEATKGDTSRKNVVLFGDAAQNIRGNAATSQNVAF